MTERDDRPFELRVRGSKRLLGVRVPTGGCEVANFLESLEPRSEIRFKALIDQLLDQGRITNQECFRKLQVPGTPAVWELKVHLGRGWRLYLIQSGHDWWATHGGPKLSDRLVVTQAERARRIFEQRRLP